MLACPHPGALPGQEEPEGHTDGEIGAAGTHSLQDARLAQLLCHVPHIKEARKLWPWGQSPGQLESGAGGSSKRGGRGAGHEEGEGGCEGQGQALRELTFPGLGLRHWMA